MTVVNLDLVTMLTVVVQIVLPIIVATVTRVKTSARVKALTLLLLTSVTQFMSTWVSGFDVFEWKVAAMNAVIGFTISVATYFGVWKPTGISGSVSRNVGVK